MNKGLTWLRLSLLSTVLICFTTLLYAQRTVSGKVTSKEEPGGAPSVTIQVKGTTTGTITDIEGNYKISVADDNAILVFSFVGLKTQEVTVGNQSVINVEMKDGDQSLSEVVVVGYGVQEKRDVTGSISQIKAAALQNVSVASFDQAMQGRAPGLQITQSSGVAGAATRVRVRGNTALGGGGDPLYVVDGIPVVTEDFSNRSGATSATSTNPLATMNMADIESIEVLKDASAGAIYGSRAANGVILITTKRGKAGKTNFTFNYYTGISNVTRTLPMLNGEQWLQLHNEGRANDGKYGKYAGGGIATGSDGLPLKALGPNEQTTVNGITFSPNSVAGNNTNWINEMFRTGIVQNADLQASGGTEKTTFLVSIGYRNEESFLKNNNFERLSGRVNINNQATDKLDFGVQLSMNYTKMRVPPTSFNGGLGLAQSFALPIHPIRNADGSYFGSQFGNGGINPVGQLENNYGNQSLFTLANLTAGYKITKDLSLRSTIGLNLRNQTETDYFSPLNNFFSPGNPRGALNERNLTASSWTTSHVLNYNKTINTIHQFKAMLGFEAQNNYTKAIGLETLGGAGFVSPYFTETVNPGGTVNWGPGITPSGVQVKGYNDIQFYRFMSFFGKIDYKFKDKYLFEVIVRSDGSSRFGSNKQFGLFPGVSAGWILSEESFIKNISMISFLKARTSFGVTGSADLPNFGWLGAYSPTAGYLGQSGINYSRLPNPDLSWTQATMVDLSIDYGFFNNRISGAISFYQKNLSQPFTERQLQVSATGFKTVTLNDPDVTVRDRGLEFNISTKNVVAKREGGFEWNTDFNITTNRNIVTSTGGLSPDAIGGGESLPGDTRIIEGQPIGTSYLAKSRGVDPKTGVELIENPKTGEAEPITFDKMIAYRQAVGNAVPDFFGGINNTLKFKGVDFSFLFSFVYGNTIYDDGAKFQTGGISQWNQRSEILGRWQSPENPGDGKTPRLSVNYGGYWVGGYNTTRFLYDGSFIRLRTVMLGYTLPKTLVSKARLNSVRVYVSAQNLLTFSDFPGWDPEVTRASFSRTESNLASNAPYLPTPQARSVTFGLSIGF